MLNKILCFIVLGFFGGLASVSAQTTPTAAARVKGQIVAAKVEGHVEAISKADGQRRILHDGDKVTDQTEIVTAPGGDVILVFSNGATVDVAADSTLDIEQFEQDPFANDVKVSELKAEPGTSSTRLNLTKGELVGKVVHLNIDQGSDFTVQTPVGAAGIRGTTFQIKFRPGPDGKAIFVVLTAEGKVLFTGTTSGKVNIPAGQKVSVTFNYTPPVGGSGQGTFSVSGESTTVSGTVPASTTELADVAQQTQNIISANATTQFTPNSSPPTTGGPTTTGGTSGGGGTDTTASGPQQTSPPLSSQAGSG
jgi:hypothetical protein